MRFSEFEKQRSIGVAWRGGGIGRIRANCFRIAGRTTAGQAQSGSVIRGVVFQKLFQILGNCFRFGRFG